MPMGNSWMWKTCLLTMMATVAYGCGSNDDDDPGDNRDLPPALDGGTWVLENVSSTPDTVSTSGFLRFDYDGVAHVAWSEPDSEDLVDQDIMTAVASDAGWNREARTHHTGVQNAFPALVAGAAKMHLLFSGSADGDNDLYHASRDASGWSGNRNLTGSFDSAALRRDYDPYPAIDAQGNIAVAYASVTVDESRYATGPEQIRVIRFTDPLAPSAPEHVMEAPGGEDCEEPVAAFDGDGALHVVATCGAWAEETVYHATDASGDWVMEAMPASGTGSQYSPCIAQGKDGVHIAWVEEIECSAGGCSEIFYVKAEGGTLGEPLSVSRAPEYDEASPVISVDPHGRVFLVYHQMNTDFYADIFVTFSEDGLTFSEPRNITPETEGTDEWMPGSVDFHPVTQLPSLTYTAIIPDTEPLNTEIFMAHLEPRG